MTSLIFHHREGRVQSGLAPLGLHDIGLLAIRDIALLKDSSVE